MGAANLQLSEDDNVLVQGVAGDKNAIGYFGFAYFTENEGKIRDLAIEGVAPTAEVVEAGEYKLARPLFIYSDAKIMADKPQVADFINFFLTNVNEEISAVGYFPASDEALQGAKNAWLVAMGMEPGEAAAAAGAAVMLPEVDPLAVSGDIIAAGSSTVFPLAEAVAERFTDEGYAGNLTIDSIGTGARVRAVLQGRRDRHRECEPGDQGLARSRVARRSGVSRSSFGWARMRWRWW